jgi:hypothetical protein
MEKNGREGLGKGHTITSGRGEARGRSWASLRGASKIEDGY